MNRETHQVMIRLFEQVCLSSSFLAPHWYPLQDVGRPFLLPFWSHCHISCHFVPAAFLIEFVHRSGGLPTGPFFGGLQFVMLTIQRSSVILETCHARHHFRDAIRSIISTTLVCWRIHWFVVTLSLRDILRILRSIALRVTLSLCFH